MAQNKQNLDELGRIIFDTVDRAVNSQDFQQLSQSIRKTVDRAVSARKESVSGSVPTAMNRSRKLYCSPFWKQVKAIVQMWCGVHVSLFGALGILGAALSEEPLFNELFAVGFLIMILGLGLWMFFSGMRTNSLNSRFKIYRRIIGNNTHCALKLLAAGMNKSIDFVRQDLQRMIDKRFFKEGYFNKEKTHILTSHESFLNYEQCRVQLEERRQETVQKSTTDQQNTQVRAILEQGKAYIEEVRRCNDVIPGEEVSEKISRIELITQRIFDRVEAHPEIIPDLKKLMEYYLPMTVKLLRAYADMDMQPVQGETIQASKREIEDTLDTINEAFENLLDDLFEDTAIDVSSDISVLQTLLAQEGLTGDDFAKLKDQTKS